MIEEMYWIITEDEEKGDCQYKAIPVEGKSMTRACFDIVMQDRKQDFAVIARESVRIGKMEVER